MVIQPAAATICPQRAAVSDILPEKQSGLSGNHLHLRYEKHLVMLQCVKCEFSDEIHCDVGPVQRFVTAVNRIVMFVTGSGNVLFVSELLIFEIPRRH